MGARLTARGIIAAGATALLLAAATPGRAVPSFARQMNGQCILCHTEFPVLNDMGRLFKLSGFTMSAEQSKVPPVAVMLMPSFTHTQAGQDGGAAPGFGNNNDYAMTQASLFYSGRLFGPYAKSLFGDSIGGVLNKVGIFSQATYDGVGKAWSWDNLDLRYADTATFGQHNALWGIYVNNNPTEQDPWNSAPAWTFPFSGSGLAPTPAAAPLIDGGLAQEVAGLGAYTMIDSKYYLDFCLYRTLPAHAQKALGVDPTDETQIANVAPYLRFAYTQPAAGGNWEVGAFGMTTSAYPGRDDSAGTDRITDIGVDTQFQKSLGQNDDITAFVTEIHEQDKWNASQALGNTAKASGSLNEFKATVNYLHDKTYGFDAQYFNINGSSDALAYGDSPENSPNSDGFVFQFDYLPFNKTQGPAFWPRSNVKFSLQYVSYLRFDGSTDNVDNTGRTAKDNNTLYLQAWIVF